MFIYTRCACSNMTCNYIYHHHNSSNSISKSVIYIILGIGLFIIFICVIMCLYKNNIKTLIGMGDKNNNNYTAFNEGNKSVVNEYNI